MTADTRSKGNALASLLRPFAKVEPEEAFGAAVLALTVFLILTAYYLLKTAREPLILLHGGAEVKSYAAAGQSVLLVVVARVYSALARRVGRLKLITIVYSFFVVNLIFFALLAHRGSTIGVAFYLWVGVFNVTAIAQFWSYAADVYTPEQGKRLFAILGIGSSVGAVAGAGFADALVSLGPEGLMAVGGLILAICVLLLFIVDKRFEAALSAAERAASEEPVVAEHAFRLLIRDRYILLIAGLTLLLNWVNSTGEYLLDRTLLASLGGLDMAAATRVVASFKAHYFSWINTAGVALQLFAVSRIITRFGVRTALLWVPIASLFSYGIILVAPVAALIRAGKIAENSLNYSLQNTARQALFLVASRLEKFVGKQVVDTIFVRLGDVLTAGTVWASTRLHLSTRGFAALNLVLVAAWIGFALAIGREHARRSKEAMAPAPLEAAA
jgi:AAA family ATP:ADP antiporter